VGGGAGLSGGVGAATYRVFTELKYLVGERRRPGVEAIVQGAGEGLVDVEPLPPPPVAVVEVVKEEVWQEGQLARVDREEIAIRDPIQFEFGKDVILPESRATLAAVAHLLRTDGRILHVVIAGHASEEGSFIYNYDLSGRRARAVWEALVGAGVHPDRVSFSGMGEVAPARVGREEGDLAANRRVVFRIVRLLEPGETAPDLPTEIVVPWSGEAGQAISPAPPPPPAPAPEDEAEF
jgi:outer membrane protein OmpA-like peptidoglycan-associated protein